MGPGRLMLRSLQSRQDEITRLSLVCRRWTIRRDLPAWILNLIHNIIG
jgi:hypothetical protein